MADLRMGSWTAGQFRDSRPAGELLPAYSLEAVARKLLAGLPLPLAELDSPRFESDQRPLQEAPAPSADR